MKEGQVAIQHLNIWIGFGRGKGTHRFLLRAKFPRSCNGWGIHGQGNEHDCRVEEVFLDKYGREKLQLYWDHERHSIERIPRPG